MNPTVLCETTGWSASPAPDSAAPPAGDPPGADEARLSFGQQRLWVLDRFEPGRALYNIPYLMRLRGRLNVDALHRALTAVVQRHETLRTVINAGEGEARPRILAEPGL